MKKELVAIFTLIFIVIFVSIISAYVQLSCSDNSKLISDQNEITIGNYRIINELGLGVTKTSESVFYKKITADLLLDTKKTTLLNKSSENSSSLETISLLSGDYTITLVKTNSTTATITVGGETVSISKLETKTAKDIFVMLTDITPENDNLIIKLIIGAKQLFLSNEKSAEKIIIGNKTYVVELSSASETNALIKVSKCASSEINLTFISETEQKSNQTANLTTSKQTEEERVKEENERLNASTKQITVAEFNARKKLNISGNETIEKSEEKQRFFSKIWNWVKRLFGFKYKAKESNNSSNMTNDSIN
ncbi:MAG: hypothetical protein AABW90_01360 [Nanoarchaeota archaeon]